jgi:hypothetical protein
MSRATKNDALIVGKIRILAAEELNNSYTDTFA